jgi:hypothetical protein
VFVHLVDAEGRVPVQRDAWPREWAYPTELWAQGEVVDDVYHLTLPADAPPGEYTIAVGMFNADTNERLSVILADGQQVIEQWIILQTVRVEPRRKQLSELHSPSGQGTTAVRNATFYLLMVLAFPSPERCHTAGTPP